MISPLAKGLFHSAISMSSSPALDAPYAQVANTNLNNYVPTTSCAKFASSEDDLYNCLINADVNELVKLTPPSWGPGWFFGLPIFGEQIGSAAIIDGEVIVKSLDDSFIHKVGSDVPIIIGNMAEEPDFDPYNVVINYTQSEYTQFIYKQYASECALFLGHNGGLA
jgi:carboxylesterase type B